MSMEKVANKQYETKNWPDIVDSDDSDVDNEIDVDNLPPLEVGPGENRLQHTYCLWFSRKETQRAAADYSKSLHMVGRCASVQQWWSLYSHLIRPTALKPYRELLLFKQGIVPMWEDPANSKGGQWLIRLRKNKVDRAWENVCMAMLGEQFLVGDEICGVVLQTKYPNPSIQVACSSRPIICIIYTRFVVQFGQCKIIIVTNNNKRNVYEFLTIIVIKIHEEMLSLLSRKCKFVNAPPNELVDFCFDHTKLPTANVRPALQARLFLIQFVNSPFDLLNEQRINGKLKTQNCNYNSNSANQHVFTTKTRATTTAKKKKIIKHPVNRVQ